MILTLQRKDFSLYSTIGELYLNDEFFCYTLEDVVRPEGVKLVGQTAIPAGTYKVVLTKSPRFGRVLPLVVDVAGFQGVRIHAGNISTHTEGCILVGYEKGVDRINKSRVAEEDLIAKIKALPAGEEAVLTIINRSEQVA